MSFNKLIRARLDGWLQLMEDKSPILPIPLNKLVELQLLREISDELHQINLNTRP